MSWVWFGKHGGICLPQHLRAVLTSDSLNPFVLEQGFSAFQDWPSALQWTLPLRISHGAPVRWGPLPRLNVAALPQPCEFILHASTCQGLWVPDFGQVGGLRNTSPSWSVSRASPQHIHWSFTRQAVLVSEIFRKFGALGSGGVGGWVSVEPPLGPKSLVCLGVLKGQFARGSILIEFEVLHPLAG